MGAIYRNGYKYGDGNGVAQNPVLAIKSGNELYKPENGVVDLSDTMPKTYSLKISDSDWSNGNAVVSVVSSKINRYNYNVMKIANGDVDDWLEFGVKGVSATVTSVDGVAVLNTITFECDPNNIPDIDLSFNIVSHPHTGSNLTPLFFEDYGYADSELDSDSVYPVQNKVVKVALDSMINDSTTTNTSTYSSEKVEDLLAEAVPKKIDAVSAMLKIDETIGRAVDQVFTALTSFTGFNIWTDGENIYFSNNQQQYVLDKSTSEWTAKTWSGLTKFQGSNIWTDGENIYHTNGSTYILDKATSTWATKTWSGLTSFSGQYIWTDGENIYFSNNPQQYVLDKSTSEWTAKTWSGLTSFQGSNIWTDGENIYHSDGTTYVLDKATSTWTTKTWSGLTTIYGSNIWTDGENIYYSHSSNQYILDKSTSTWATKTWSGLTSFSGYNIWTDGENIYFSNNATQKKLIPKPKILSVKLR